MRQKSWQRLFQVAVYIACIITLLRLGWDFFRHTYPEVKVGIDLQIFFDAVQAFLRGVDPYNDSELRLGRDDVPIVFPPQILIIVPFQFLGEKIGTPLFVLFNIALSFLLFKAVFKQLGIWHPPTSWTLSTKNQICLISLCVFYNLLPVSSIFYRGQTTLIAVACLFFAMLAKGVFIRALLLAIAVAAKYSLVPFICLAFLIIRDFRTCALAALLFFAIAILPVMVVQNPYVLYQSYFTKIGGVIEFCGPDTYCGGGGPGELLNFDFFKVTWLNTAVKAILLVLFVLAFIKEFIRRMVSLNFLLFASVMTLITAYHRYYDLAALNLLMIAFLNGLLYRRQWVDSVILSAFLAFPMIVLSWIYTIENSIGTMIGKNQWIYIESYGPYPITFPLYAIYTFVLTCYIAYLYFRDDPTIEFLG